MRKKQLIYVAKTYWCVGNGIPTELANNIDKYDEQKTPKENCQEYRLYIFIGRIF